MYDCIFPTKFLRTRCWKNRTLGKGISFGSQRVFWGSAWAKAEAEERYHVEFPNGTVLRTGGNLGDKEIHRAGSHPRQKALLFVSLDFEAKEAS